METMTDFIFLDSKITADDDCSHEIKRPLLLGRKAMTNLESILKSRDITLQTKVHLVSQGYSFSSSQVWMWELDYKESWVQKNWCFWTVVLEKTLESPRECHEIKPVTPKGNQPWIFIGRTDDEAEAPIFWLPNAKNWLLGKDPDAGRDWKWDDGWVASPTRWTWVWAAIAVGNGQGDLACYSPWGCKELETTEWLNWTELPEGNHVSVSLLLDEESSIFFLTIMWENESQLTLKYQFFLRFQ